MAHALDSRNGHYEAMSYDDGPCAQSTRDNGRAQPHRWIRTDEAVNSVFLPRRLPSSLSESEDPMKSNFGRTDALRSFARINQDILPPRTQRMLEAWNDTFEPDSHRLYDAWQRLETGDTFPIHLTAQNAALTFTLLEGEKVEVCGYDIQPTAGTVVSAEGPLTAQQPRISVCVPAESALSQTMADQVCALQRHIFPDAVATSKRRHTDLLENRDVINSKYVFEWLLSVLAVLKVPSPARSTVAVEKKVRDVVLFPKTHDPTTAPWRRHPSWLAMKFVLHATLVNNVGHHSGTLLYKAAMLKFMTEFLRGHRGAEYALSDDVLKQMLAKVANRTHKLSVLLQQYSDTDASSQVTAKCHHTLDEAADMTVEVNNILSLRWQQGTEKLQKQSQLPTMNPVKNSEEPTVLPLEICQGHIAPLLGQRGDPDKTQHGEMERHANADAIAELSSGGGSYSKEGRLIGLHAWEEEILQLWESRNTLSLSPSEVLTRLQRYRDATSRIYAQNDAIAQSRRILVAAVLMALCDRSVTNSVPLLLQHQTDVDVTSLEAIVTTTPLEMKVLLGVEQHFQERQSEEVVRDGPLNSKVNAASVSVRYASHEGYETSQEMRDHLTELLRVDQEKEDRHVTSVKQQLQQIRDDEQRLASMKCEDVTENYWTWDNKLSKRTVHSSCCGRCRLDNDLSRRSEYIFERQLPPEHNYRLASVFEVLIPTSIRDWRDCTLLFNESFLLSVSFQHISQSIRKCWVNHLAHCSPSGEVSLGSTNVAFADSHYRSQKLRGATWSEFVKPSNLNCNLSSREYILPSPQCNSAKVRKLCTFTTKERCLQLYITSSDHQQSDVIADQKSCPEYFSTREFVTFGSIRAGNRLQWFNILRGIHQRTLLLHRVEVAQLIAQSVWQVDSNDVRKVLRDAHHPCQDPVFVREFTAELERVLTTVQGNWVNYWSLCSVVILTNRLLSLYQDIGESRPAKDVLNGLKKILADCRVTAVEWLDKIRSLTEKVEADDARDLQSAAAHIAAFGVLTYQHFVLLQPAGGRALFHWLKFVTDLQCSTVLNQSRPQGFLETLFNHTLRIAFNNHNSMLELFDSGTGDGKNAEFEEFLRTFYSPGRSKAGYTIHQQNQMWICCQWLTEAGCTECIQLDLRQGNCWINGLPPGRLPSSITATRLFSRHFGTTVFIVNPCTSPHGQLAQTTSALGGPESHAEPDMVTDQLEDCKQGRVGPFIFSSRDRSRNKNLCIYESHASGRVLLLLDEYWFSNEGKYDVPALMVEEHSFWLDIESKEIFLRPVNFREKDFPHLDRCEYVLNFGTRQMRVSPSASVGVPPNSLMLSGESQIGRHVLSVMSRIELVKYVEMWMDANGDVHVRLPRLGLSFLRKANDLSHAFDSVDYHGWSIDADQGLGTLLGLKTGLVLVHHKDSKIEERCLLLPHGQPQYVSGERYASHSSVRMSLENLAEPAMFRFVVNSQLRALQAPDSYCAWFYLALLHAMTSSVHEDPFTGMTGTEMSMCILQSARCWPSSPLDGPSLRWLKRLTHYSPKRSHYPEHMKVMQTVKWPSDMPSLCASDAYILLVDQIISASQEVLFLHPGRPTDAEKEMLKDVSERSVRSLNKMAYLQSRDYLPLLARMKTERNVSTSRASPAFSPVSEPNVPSQETAHRIISGHGTAMSFSVTSIETALLQKTAEELHSASKTFEEDYESVAEQGTLSSCNTWPDVDLLSSFIALHGFVEKRRTASRLQLALMFSFWTWQGKQSTCLLELLVALANQTSLAHRPALRCFPSPRSVFPKDRSNFMTTEFIHDFDLFAWSQGLYEPPDSDDDDAEELYWRRRNALRSKYRAKHGRVKAAVAADVIIANSLIASGPYANSYNISAPCNLPMSFNSTCDDVISVQKYQDSFRQQLTDANSTHILHKYARLVMRIASPVPVCSCPVFSDGRLYYIAQRRQSYAESRIVTASSDTCSQPSMSNGFLEMNVNLETSNQQVECATYSQLETVIRIHNQLAGMTDPIAKDFAIDLSESCGALPQRLHQPQERCDVDFKCGSHNIESSLDLATGELMAVRRAVKTIFESNSSRKSSVTALLSCGLLTRPVPLALLPALLPHTSSIPGMVQENMDGSCKNLIGQLLVAMVMAQRWSRLLHLELGNHSDMLQRELANAPHTTWLPCEHVEWLLFELENNVCVWEKQVAVARQMMSPSGEKHAVMQLNMGEGKTSVILPIIAAELADGKALVRIIVLTSLHNTNFQQLVFKLGGLLGHRVYTLPFRRDIPLTADDAKKLRSFLCRARKEKSVMVTVREHILSLAVKHQEACYKENTDLAVEMSRLMQDVRQFGRDIIDEADEVLHHRFQLVYPLGDEEKPDGGDIRWLTAEMVLEAVKEHVAEVHDQFQTTIHWNPKSAQSFPFVRIQVTPDESAAYRVLCKKIVRYLFSGRGSSMAAEFMDEMKALNSEQTTVLEEFVLTEEMPWHSLFRFNGIPLCDSTKKTLLCLRGLLASGVLKLALKKRYRVKYGLVATTNIGQRQGSSTRRIRMAVPFRAKDVAAERTEFGHPDVAIVLTVLSYYQHGLTDDQINIVLDKLSTKEARNDIYNSWVVFAKTELVDARIREFGSINRKDPMQMKNFVYPFLRHNMFAINFFVNSVIFPSEAKEFPSKLVANGWSMTSSSRQKKVTGFSGTNDTRHLLPGSTEQQDLEELKHTNAYVCSLLLQEHNNRYNVLPENVNGRKLFDQIVSYRQGCRVNTLIDAGAVVLDLTNQQAAVYWLSKRTDKQAVVYFDTDNQLRVQDRRSHKPCKLELSPYASNLSECLVYLDHAHCRGTDLRMVDGTLAAVTLGKNLRRDEFVQACMRMRRLRSTHFVSFWAPAEIDRQIRQLCSVESRQKVEHRHVLFWCFLNSISATESGFYSWASQGLVHLRTEDALRGISAPELSPAIISAVGQGCRLDDRVPLSDMYGQAQHHQRIPDIISSRGKRIPTAEHLVEHCRRFVPEIRRIAQELDEEQEREMEQELEEERQRQLPPAKRPVKETLPPALLRIATSGRMSALDLIADLGAMWQCLQGTTLPDKFRSLLHNMPWGGGEFLAATDSFRDTVELEYGRGSANAFLRPVEWLLLVGQPYCQKLVLLSPFQANELVKHHRRGSWNDASSLLMYASVGYKQQSIMSDWPCTLAGRPLSPLRGVEHHLHKLFAEILCFSGGLFFGADRDEMLVMMKALAEVFHLQPHPAESGNEAVKHVALISKKMREKKPHSQHDSIMFLRQVLSVLRSRESLELSEMGSLLLRRAWP